MKCVKIAAVLIVPALGAGLLALILFHLSGNYTGLFSHDIPEAHIHRALIPAICTVAFALVYFPGMFYIADLLFPLNRPVIEANDAILSAQPEVGQTFTSVGANCILRIKTLKTANP